MNRNNKILVGVLAFVVAMTIGYAIFSDKITVTGTAKAKGDFNLKITCSPGINSEIDALADGMKDFTWLNSSGYFDDSVSLLAAYPENNYSNDTCVVEDNNVKFHVDLSQPGARRYFTVKVVNDGSIPIENIEYNDSDPTITAIATLKDKNITSSEFGNDSFSDSSIKQFAGLVGDGLSASQPDFGFVTGDSLYFVFVINFPEELYARDANGSDGLSYYNIINGLDMKIDYNASITFTQLLTQ